jgi:hypothetical protein
MFAAIDRLGEVYNSRLPDKALEMFGGPEAVAERDRLLGARKGVVPLKRNGRPL